MNKIFKYSKNRHMSMNLDIISLYLDDYNKSLNGREIARKLEINHQTALNYLNILVKENILFFKRVGKNKEYLLDINNILTKLIIDAAEAYKTYKFLIKNQKIKLILNEIKNLANTIIVFGSYAEETFDKRSDLDLLVLGTKSKKEINSIKDKFILQINIKYSDFEDFEKKLWQKNNLAIEIIKKHIVLGEISRFTNILWRWFNERR